MLKLHALLLLAVFISLTSSRRACAAPCFTLLENARPVTEVKDVELAAARQWLEVYSGGDAFPQSYHRNAEVQNFVASQGVNWNTLDYEAQYDWAAKFVLERWRQWRGLNSSQRGMALRLEISKLNPAAPETVIAPLRISDLAALSAQNRQRNLLRVRELFPVFETNDVPRIDWMSQQLRIKYIRYRELTLPTGRYEPLASQREMKALGVLPPIVDQFFSDLLGGSSTIGFEGVGVLPEATRIYNFGGGEPKVRLAYLLDSAFAEEQGFTLPTFKDAASLIQFFNFWDPSAVDQLLRQNALSLPKSIRSRDELLLYLKSAPGASVFPRGSEFDRLTSLRSRLSQYLMTQHDAELFYQEAFKHWLHYLREYDVAQFRVVEREWVLMGGVQQVLRTRFLPALHLLDGLSLRVPLAVSKDKLNLVHIQGIYFNPTLLPLRPGRIPQLDYTTMP